MKLEGEDRERPYDDVTVILGTPAMTGCWWLAQYFATTGLSHALVTIVAVYSMGRLLPLFFAEHARLYRINKQLDEEIARQKARLAELERQANEKWWDQR